MINRIPISILYIIFLNEATYALPILNFTDNVLSNRMIEALNTALVSQDRQQLLTSLQNLQQHYQQPSYQEIFLDNQQHHGTPSYSQQYPDYYQMHLTGDQQPPHYYQPQPSVQPGSNFYFGMGADQYGQFGAAAMTTTTTVATPAFFKPHIPDPLPGHFYDPSFIHHSGQPAYQPQPQFSYQPGLPEQQYHIPHQPIGPHPQPLPGQQSHVPYPEHIPTAQIPPNNHPPNTLELSNPLLYPQYQPDLHLPINGHPQPSHQIIPSQHYPEVHPQNVGEQVHIDYAGANSHHPDLHQNVNWFNHFNSWESAIPSQHDAKSPVQVIQAQPAITLANECPTGLCPLGATCSQNSGQWQCACGQNACRGVENPCGIFGRYYFPYYPDASRFIQCDQTGVFWIRKCAPGTVFDPKISVCNYPPVVVEPGK